MQYSNIRSRAGLIALIFALIISLVSAAPIPLVISLVSAALIPTATASGLSSRSNLCLNGRQLQFLFSGRMSTLPLATRLIFGPPISSIMDDQLVRRSIASKLKSFGQKVKQKFEKAGSAIKQGFKTVGRAIKHEVQMVGKGIKKVVKKVVNFVKTTGAKIVKFGLKVAESVLALGAKVVGFIPGIGKPLGKVIDGVSKVAGVIGGKIHTALSHPLETGMKVMKKALGAMKYIPR